MCSFLIVAFGESILMSTDVVKLCFLHNIGFMVLFGSSAVVSDRLIEIKRLLVLGKCPSTLELL